MKTKTKAKPRQTTKLAKSAKTEIRANAEIRAEIRAIALFAAAVLLFIGVIMSGAGGFLPSGMNRLLVGLFGFGAYLLPFITLLWGILLLVLKDRRLSLPKFFMFLGIFIILISFLSLIGRQEAAEFGSFGERVSHFYQVGGVGGGGVVGGVFSFALSAFLGRAGAFVVMIAGIIALCIAITGKSFVHVFIRLLTAADKKISDFREERREAAAGVSDEDFEENSAEQEFVYDPRTKDGYVYETHGREAPRPRPKLLPKKSSRKVFDYVVREDEEGYEDEPAIYLMDVPNTPKRAAAPVTAAAYDERDGYDEYADYDEYNGFGEYADEAPDDESAKIIDFRSGESFRPVTLPTPGFMEVVDEDAVEEEYYDDISEGALEGVSISEDTDSAADDDGMSDGISIKGTGVEGYVPTTVTATGEDDFAEIEPPIPNVADVFDDLTTKDTKITKIAESVFADEERPYTLPTADMLEKNTYIPSPSSKAQILENSRKLEETLKSFGVEAKVVEVSKGPTVTRYELSPGVGVKVSKISNLADDLALNLAALGIRIEAPIPGKSVVGIEIPNSEVQMVTLRDVVDGEAFRSFPSRLGFAVGKDIAGNSVIVDIAKMPHLLIAGATGAGKSVCINTIIASILLKSTPDEVKMLMIDPKVVELNVYNGIPHLEIPVVTDPHKAAGALSWGVREMNERYNAFARTGTRDLKGYNETLTAVGEKPLPQIIIIIDELADLMMSAKADVEQNICRLAQKARAAGIHLIIATQRPSVDVITGLIKANVPSRLAFAVTSGTDSRTILDMVGAEKLLGKGDMLFSPAGLSKPQRIQGAFISDKEVERLVTFIKQENGEATYDAEKIERMTKNSKDDDTADDMGDDADEHIRAAISFVADRGKASVSMLQRQFRIGYNRAARMMDMLEERGIVGPEDGAKPRKVLIGSKADL